MGESGRPSADSGAPQPFNNNDSQCINSRPCSAWRPLGQCSTTGEDSILLFGSQPGIGEILELTADMIPCDNHTRRVVAWQPPHRFEGKTDAENSASWVRW
jgi:hypothetical protein